MVFLWNVMISLPSKRVQLKYIYIYTYKQNLSTHSIKTIAQRILFISFSFPLSLSISHTQSFTHPLTLLQTFDQTIPSLQFIGKIATLNCNQDKGFQETGKITPEIFWFRCFSCCSVIHFLVKTRRKMPNWGKKEQQNKN